ncbi:MAG TPA: HAMP domain-containing sensor histidine kinase, partial [Puia sp.]|nr:HAMP domain-containing sensor histidine kinase [Puia sp.]
WSDYCEALRINSGGVRDNYITLQHAAIKGLQLTPAGDAEDRSRFYFYTALGYYYQVKFDSAQAFFYQSLHEAQKSHIVKQITKACVALIPVNFQLQQKDKVEECKNILQSIVDSTRDTAILEDGDYALGSYYQQKSYYSTAQDYFIKSLELREKEVDTTTDRKKKFDYAIQCDMLSKLYLNTQMTDKSLNVLRQGNRFAAVSPNVGNRLLSSFVEAFTTSGNIDSALYYNQRLAEQTKDNPIFPSEIVSSNLNIAIYYIDHRLFSNALPYIRKGEAIAAQVKSPLLLFQTQLIAGRYDEETGKSDEAIALLNQSLPVAKQYSRELYSNALKTMALAQKGKGNINAAISYYEQYAGQTDSITREKLSANFADQETRYQTARKEQQIASLDKENRLEVLELQNASRTRQLLVIGLAALGVIALLMYFIYRNKEKLNRVLNKKNDQLGELNRQLALANETKARLFGIIGHDLRAPVSKIVQLLHLQKENPGLLDEQSKQKHEEKIKTASENVLGTMEDLLLWSKSQMQHFIPQSAPLKIKAIVRKESDFLQQAVEDKNLRINNEVPEDLVFNTDENFLSVIIRNLLQNSVKYSEENSTISISADDREIQITNKTAAIRSVALNQLLQKDEVNSKSSGMGLQIAKDLAAAIHAKILFRQPDDLHLTAVVSWDA